MCMYGEYTPAQKREALREAREEALQYSAAKKRAYEYIRSMPDALPPHVTEWAKKQLPRYMFFVKIKRGSYEAFCECCGERVHLTRAMSARKTECPACGAIVTLKDGVRNPNGTTDYCACSYLERDGDAVVQRLFDTAKAVWFTGDSVATQYYFGEEQRDYRIGAKWFWFYPKCYGRNAGEWKYGPGRVHGQGWSAWRLQDRPIHTYPCNLRAVLRGTKYEYSALDIAAENNLVNPFFYFKHYEREPKLELLYKVGLYRAAEEIAEEYSESAHHMMRDIRSLKDLGIGSRAEAAECACMTVGQIVARKEIKTWKIGEEERAAALEFVVCLNQRSGTDFRYDFISRERMFRYFLTQHEDYREAKNFIADYTDYISECVLLGANVNDTAVKTPRSLKKAHDWATTERKVQEKQAYEELVAAVYDSLHALTEWSDGKLRVIMPRSAREIVEEGIRQNHCVGRYVERVATGESVILFLRRVEDPEKNFYTVEIKKDMRRCHIVQVRGEHNASATDEVNAFCKKYARWFNRRSLNGYDGDTVIVRYYKAVHKRDGRYMSGWDGKTEYRVGEWIEAETDGEPDRVAVKGLHVASLEFAVNYGKRWKDAAILEVETDIHDVIVPDAKDQVRTRRFRVVREVPREEIANRAAENAA